MRMNVPTVITVCCTGVSVFYGIGAMGCVG